MIRPSAAAIRARRYSDAGRCITPPDATDPTPQPTADELPRACDTATEHALQLAGMVRDEAPATTWQLLEQLTRPELHTLAIALAAMVPVDRTERQLLAWTEGLVA